MGNEVEKRIINMIRSEFRKTWGNTYYHYGIIDGSLMSLYEITGKKIIIESTIRSESDLDILEEKLTGL